MRLRKLITPALPILFFAAGGSLGANCARADGPRYYEISETPRSREISRMQTEIVDMQNKRARLERQSGTSIPAVAKRKPTDASASSSAEAGMTSPAGNAPAALGAAAPSGPRPASADSGYAAAVSGALPSPDSLAGKILPDPLRGLVTQPFHDLDAQIKKRDADLKALDNL